jgi:hypothetical protein
LAVRRLPRLIKPIAVVAALIACSGCAAGFPKAPADVTTTSASLRADIYSTVGADVSSWFRYGQTTTYDSETPHTTFAKEPNQFQGVDVLALGLEPDTLYHWQVCAQDFRDAAEQPPRTNCSKDQTFRTLGDTSSRAR